ncbi:polymer-forming cytoskeletal protein [Fusobacterium necrophorum]|uniref:polymer-forming cytoskeletal protein n=1 Tax=Fusobacterium necrophorum TaxID=859 RepID=UPI0030A20A1D
MNKKYEFTGEEKEFCGRTLKRIKAKISFGNVVQGEVGGWIEKEENLSEHDDAWVYDNALVCDDAWVCDNAKVCDDAWVYDNAWVCDDAWVCDNAKVCDNALVCGDAWVTKTRHTISFTKVGSRNDTLTAFRTKTGFSIKIGCFLGSLELFLEKVQETHGDNQFAKEYRLIAEVIKARFEVEE